MDGVSRGLMMRVAVCGWGAVRGEVHESADRGGTRREQERSASAEGGQGRGGQEARGGAHEGGGGGAGITMRSLHRGSVVGLGDGALNGASGTEVLQSTRVPWCLVIRCPAARGRRSSCLVSSRLFETILCCVTLW